VRWRLAVAYDGGPFHGFAHQPGQDTVAGVLAAALARTLRLPEPPSLTCAGRTDAGVHARAQVVHVDLPAEALAAWERGLPRALNRQLAPAVVVHAAGPAPPGFDARRSALERCYRYLVWNAPTPDPLLAPLSWHVATPLRVRAMRSGADALMGEHDFRAFCRRAPGTTADQPIIRRVTRAGWRVDPGLEAVDAGWPLATGWGSDAPVEPADPRDLQGPPGQLLRFEIDASSFCHQMVRSLVAALVEIGRGRSDPAALVALLRSADRQGAPDPAPPHGLCLAAVRYPPDDQLAAGRPG
jgi:tRNA pseudouridine38-40 synthase